MSTGASRRGSALLRLKSACCAWRKSCVEVKHDFPSCRFADLSEFVGTPELRLLFDDVGRMRSWLEILATLAETQADSGLIPPDAAHDVAATCRTVELDAAFFEEVRAGFEATNHSTLGLIRALQRRCPAASGEWLYYGATVQDITDTWMALALQKVQEVVERELAAIEHNLLQLAAQHRDTVMAGRTHGQIGLPITFGFKVAIWATEVRRHRQRLAE